VVEPLGLQELVKDALGKGLEGRVGRGEDGVGTTVAGEGFIETGGIDGGDYS